MHRTHSGATAIIALFLAACSGPGNSEHDTGSDPDAVLDVHGDILEDAPADVSEEEILEDADEEDVEPEGELPVAPPADRVL
ncbi:MAG: hypothetical protein JRG91_16890, partial [Deltaproteobacteria bacterium]|nr:hypothetical protein [Deltaproteobacteria bacterium]